MESRDDKKITKGRPKMKMDQRKYQFGQFVANLAGVLITTPIFVYITFNSFGKGTGDLFTVPLFCCLYIFCFMVIQCWGAVTNTRKDYLRGKWIMEAAQKDNAPDRLIKNPWRLIAPYSLIAGLITGAITALVVAKLGQEPFHPLNINFIAGIPLFAVSSILIGIILPRDQSAYTAALNQTNMPSAPFRRYLVIEHILPWMLIQGTINFTIGLKQFFNEAQKLATDIPIFASALDSGIVAVIIVFFMWLSSQTQVRPDIHFGRVPEDRRKALALPLMILLILSFLGVGAPIWGILKISRVSSIAPFPAAGLKAIVAMASVIPGCWLGIWWGKRRETALVKTKNISHEQSN